MLTRTQGIWLAFPGNGSRHSINAKSTGDACRDLYALARNLATPKVRRDYPEAKRNNIQLQQCAKNPLEQWGIGRLMACAWLYECTVWR